MIIRTNQIGRYIVYFLRDMHSGSRRRRAQIEGNYNFSAQNTVATIT